MEGFQVAASVALSVRSLHEIFRLKEGSGLNSGKIEPKPNPTPQMKRTKIQSCVEFSQCENKENPNYLIYNDSSGSLMGMSHERSRKTSTVTKKHKGESVSSVRRFSQTCLDNLPLRFKNRKSY